MVQPSARMLAFRSCTLSLLSQSGGIRKLVDKVRWHPFFFFSFLSRLIVSGYWLFLQHMDHVKGYKSSTCSFKPSSFHFIVAGSDVVDEFQCYAVVGRAQAVGETKSMRVVMPTAAQSKAPHSLSLCLVQSLRPTALL